MNKLTIIKLHYKLRLKYKKKRHEAFNVKVNNDIFFLFLDSEDKKKVNNKIIILLKKTVNKIFKFK